MAKCPRCQSRKGKRSCPALATEICARCCAEGRLQTIACPADCVHLKSELYQHERRMALAFSRGRAFVKGIEAASPAAPERSLAMKICADIYYFLEHEGRVSDLDLAAAIQELELLRPFQDGPPPDGRPLTLFLDERLADVKRYPEERGAGHPERIKVLLDIARRARLLAQDGTHSYVEELSSFFRELDFESDLDYSPRDGKDPSEPLYRPREGGQVLPAS